MHTLAPVARLTNPRDPAFVLLQAPDPLADGDRAIRVLTLVIVAVLVVLAVRTVSRALAPIIELASTFVAASMATVLLLTALILVMVVAVGYA